MTASRRTYRVKEIVLLFAVSAIGLCLSEPLHSEESYKERRMDLLREIASMARLTEPETGKHRFQSRVMDAMSLVKRHEFVPEGLRHRAYYNTPLPIGHGQTISQPYIVALMTDLLKAGPSDKVLEVGTGSGYQAAVLAELVNKVFTIEIIEPLAEEARSRLKRLGYENVVTRVGDGYYGWQEESPFDAVIVTAASSHIPPPLIRQLSPGGRMVIPVGGRFQVQYLTLIEKKRDGTITTRQLLPVAFVPLTGGH